MYSPCGILDIFPGRFFACRSAFSERFLRGCILFSAFQAFPVPKHPGFQEPNFKEFNILHICSLAIALHVVGERGNHHSQFCN